MALHVKDGESHFDEVLLHCIQKGNVTVLQSFFRNDNPDVTDSSGKTLLHYAAKSNNVSMTQHLTDNKYNVDIRDHDGNTPLMLALQSGSVDAAKLLIKADANIYFRDSEGGGILSDKLKPKIPFDIYPELVKSILEKVRKDCWNDEKLFLSRLTDVDCSLIKAVYLGDPNVTKLMLENGYLANELDPNTDETALEEAIDRGDFKNTKILLEYGADAKGHGVEGYPVLHSFNFDGELAPDDRDDQVKLLKILIEHGALLSQPEEGHKTPSEYLLEHAQLWALKIAMQYNDFVWEPEYSLFDLVRNENADVLEAVRDKKFDLTAIKNPIDLSVLSLAVSTGHLAKVQFLLDFGADPNFIDKDGSMPFMDAFAFSDSDTPKEKLLPIVRLMLEYGADAQYSFGNELTVFDVTVERGYETLFEPVIAHLAMIDSLGKTITALIRKKINSQGYFKNQFELCKGQLEGMKNTTVFESVTLYKLLTESQLKITRYARNQAFAPSFKRKMKTNLSLDPYYSISLRKRVGKAINTAALKKEAVIEMKKLFGYPIISCDEILSEIIEYLNNDDLKNVCKVSDFGETESFNLDTLFA